MSLNFLPRAQVKTLPRNIFFPCWPRCLGELRAEIPIGSLIGAVLRVNVFGRPLQRSSLGSAAIKTAAKDISELSLAFSMLLC